MRSLQQALDALEADHASLLRGDVFTKDVIETWISYKREKEVDAIALRLHPYEFHLYFRHLGPLITTNAMSALPKADMCSAPTHVCYGPKADIAYCFTPSIAKVRKVAYLSPTALAF